MGRKLDKFGETVWSLIKQDVSPDQLAIDYVREKWNAKTCPVTRMKDELRFQHLLLVGGSGCGKSTFFQEFLTKDLPRAKKGKCSVIHIDPVIANDEIIKYAGVERYKNAILIDVSDPDSLPCLDLFETSSTRDERLRTSNLIGVFTSVCAGLVEQALTPQMKTLFSYCAQVAVRMDHPGLRDVLSLLTKPIDVLDHYGFEPSDAVYQFFQEEVVGTGKGRTPMRETATSIRARVHGVLCDPIVERIFCAGKPTLSLIKAINDGSMIFVATRKGHLTTDGSRLLGNYILTLTHRAMQERVDVEPEHMMPTFLYYDEVHNAFSGGYNQILAEMLDEDRKYKLSVNIATTRFGHINTDMGDAILSCTETKIAGKMAPKGAGALALEMFGVDGGGVAKLTELGNYKFFCRIKSLTDRAVKIGTRPDPIRTMGKKNPNAMKNFRERMKLKYGSARLTAQNAVVEEDAPAEEVKPVERTDPLQPIGAL